MSRPDKDFAPIDTTFSPKVYKAGIRDTEMDRINELAKEGKTPDEIEDITGIYSETIEAFLGDDDWKPAHDANAQIKNDANPAGVKDDKPEGAKPAKKTRSRTTKAAA